MFTIAKREDQGPPLPQSGFPPVGVDGLACGFGHTVGVDGLACGFGHTVGVDVPATRLIRQENRQRNKKFVPVGEGSKAARA